MPTFDLDQERLCAMAGEFAGVSADSEGSDENKDESPSTRVGMGPDGIAECGIRQSSYHGSLHRSHDLSSIDSKGCETENAIAGYFYQVPSRIHGFQRRFGLEAPAPLGS